MEERDIASSSDPQPERFRWSSFEVSLFLEVLSVQVAINATRNLGRLAAAPALCNLFKVYSTWREISDYDKLWENLTSVVWDRKHLLRDTWTWRWREEYMYHHRIARNIYASYYMIASIPISLPEYNVYPRVRPPDIKYAIPPVPPRELSYAIPPNLPPESKDDILIPPLGNNVIPIPPPENNDWDNNRLICLRLALSDQYFAAGYSNGMVELYLKSNTKRVRIFYQVPHDDRVGGFSNAVTGIILSRRHLVFSSLDGDICVVKLNHRNPHLASSPSRVAHYGDIINDGSLVDFAGGGDWWVGLYVGAIGRAFHVWNKETEDITYIGGTLTDPEVIHGRLLLAHISESVGRITVSSDGIAIACTARRAIKFNLRNPGVTLATVEYPDPNQPIMLRCFYATDDLLLLVNGSGWASVRRDLNDEVIRFRVRDGGVENTQVIGCMNNGYIIIHEKTGGVFSVWDANGRFLNLLKHGLNDVTAVVIGETHMLASTSNTLCIWDFGAIG